jgi:hypothetical protein
MSGEGLADIEAANPFRLPRLHPGIGLVCLLHREALRLADYSSDSPANRVGAFSCFQIPRCPPQMQSPDLGRPIVTKSATLPRSGGTWC